ncbi:MAG: hypothetical protein LBV47_01020 [Bacteroidales bacterium]|nr:hypothetical protein [Bacteroidales bacterium]
MKILKFVALIALLAGVFSCTKNIELVNSQYFTSSSEKKLLNEPNSSFAVDSLITSFEVDGIVDMTVDIRNINEKETVTVITLKMEEGSDVTSLAPSITLAPDATIIPESGTAHDFSKHVVYAVTTEDGTRAIYLAVSESVPQTRAITNITISATTGGGVEALITAANGSSKTHYIVANTSRPFQANDLWATAFWAYQKDCNYFLDGWYLNNSTSPVSNELNFSHILYNDDELKAKYVVNRTVNVQSENTNRGTVSGGGITNDVGKVTINATPKTGYTFDGWYYPSGTIKQYSSANYTFKPSGNITLEARFNMTATITGASSVCVGSNTTFTVNAPGSFSWGSSSNISINGSGNSVTVSGGYNGAGWVRVIDAFNNKEVTRYNVWVGVPELYSVYSEQGMSCWAGYTTHWTAHSYSDLSQV